VPIAQPTPIIRVARRFATSKVRTGNGGETEPEAPAHEGSSLFGFSIARTTEKNKLTASVVMFFIDKQQSRS
jgi:hypothetical protein